MDTASADSLITAKMTEAGVGGPTVRAFLAALRQVRAGARGMVPESDIDPVGTLPRLEDQPDPRRGGERLIDQLVVIKLNGGLGTGMGLDRAKSLIAVRGEMTFLDFIARQVLGLRAGRGTPAFYLMNSFSTRQDSLEHLRKYRDLAPDGKLDFLQNRVPKLVADTLLPVSWPPDPALEWCPPGHGDLYPSLLGSGLLGELLDRGLRYAFVSNSDNLGATVDRRILHYFAQADLSFLMEVAERTAADRKGGHLARRTATGRLLLRESAQTPKEDEAAFQDVTRHRFFNTNNLWVRLDRLKSELDRHNGALPLPLITNAKTVDPRDPASTKVLQLESAMGAAIECFDESGALVVPRSRFSPVKTTGDLLALRSDAYELTDDDRLVLHADRRGQPPVVDLDTRHYRVLAGFDACFADAVPSLRSCDVLRVTGRVRFSPGVVCRGRVEFTNPSDTVRTVRPGSYADTAITLE